VVLTPFHIAVQVRNLAEAREFYGTKMGLAEGRSSETWIDFDMFGHQFVVHVNPQLGPHGTLSQEYNPVDGHGVPVPHYGVVLTIPQWEVLASRMRTVITEFVIEPTVRFKGRPGEQRTMFFRDPSGNALEFKAFEDIERSLFAK
jgi:extradiol dioxygenase family protein